MPSVDTPTAARAIDAGADPVDLAAAMTSAPYDGVFGVLYLLDYQSETDGNGDAAHGWVLVDADLEAGDLVPGSPDALNGLHEELLMADPLEIEARDFLT